MVASFEERDEIIVVNDSLDLMRDLRKEIAERFPKVWIVIHCDNIQKRYGLEVLNIWGGKLEDNILSDVQDVVENFITEKGIDFKDYNDYVERYDNDEDYFKME